MNKHRKIENIEQLERFELTDQIELINWAFEHGYQLAKHDTQQGIHIEFSEIKKQFERELIEYINNKNSSNQIKRLK